MLLLVIILIAITSNKASNLGSITREEGEDVVFMFNTSSPILSVTWGIRDGDSKIFKLKLISVSTRSGVQSFPNAYYAGRVHWAGDLSKSQAWFNITNLTVKDTNQYMTQIFIQGGTPGQYDYSFAKLIVIQPATTASPSTTSLTPTDMSQEPTTVLPTTVTPTILKNLTTTLEVKREFSPDMVESSSSGFKDFANEFQAEIKKAYVDESKFESVTVIRLRKGSIIVTFVVLFKREIEYDQACLPLKNAINDGTLGNFTIVPGSLECSKPKPTKGTPVGPPNTKASVHPGIIAGVAVVGVLAIVGLVITIIFVCRKKASKKDYRSSTRPGAGYAMEARQDEPEEQYASVQKPAASGATQSRGNNPPLPQYAAVDKGKKTKKKKTRDPDELVYAELDHDFKASMGRPQSDPRASGETGDTVYADIRSGNQQQRHPPPQYGNIHETSYA